MQYSKALVRVGRRTVPALPNLKCRDEDEGPFYDNSPRTDESLVGIVPGFAAPDIRQHDVFSCSSHALNAPQLMSSAPLRH